MTNSESSSKNFGKPPTHKSLTPAVSFRKRNTRGAFVGAACMLIGVGTGFGMGIFGTASHSNVRLEARSPINHMPLSKKHPVSKAFLGISYLPKQNTQSSKQPHQMTGKEVLEVIPHTAAAIAGIVKGDVILAVDGTPIGAGNHLSRVVASHASGETVKVSIQRGDNEITKELVLGKGPIRNSCSK